MYLHRLVFLVIGFCLLGTSAGCGPSDPLGRRAVSGTVTLDGAPVAEGSINFEPTERSTTSSGAVIKEGEYSIPKENGLPPGKYRVVINALKPGTGSTLAQGAMPGAEKTGSPAVELVPPEWNTGSKHFVEVSDSDPSVEFKHEIVTKK